MVEIANWTKWQNYRKDRGTPPWIKVYRNLMSNPEWAVLSDSEKGQLVSLWILAADKAGTIPEDPIILQKMCMLDNLPNINKFKELGFLLTTGDQLVTMRPQHDTPETETETETETDGKKYKPPVPDGVDVGLWKEYLKTRTKLKAPNSQRAITTLTNKLLKLVTEGHSANDLIETANSSGWKSVFAPNQNQFSAQPAQSNQRQSEEL